MPRRPSRRSRRPTAPRWPKDVAKITDDREELVAFHDFPAEHWFHLRTTNPIESAFSTVKLRTKVTRGADSPAAALAMAFKLVESAQERWRAVTAPRLVALVRGGARFENGHLVERPEAHQPELPIHRNDNCSPSPGNSRLLGSGVRPHHSSAEAVGIEPTMTLPPRQFRDLLTGWTGRAHHEYGERSRSRKTPCMTDEKPSKGFASYSGRGRCRAEAKCSKHPDYST